MLRVTDLLATISQPFLNSFIRDGSLEVIEQGYPLITLGDGNGPCFSINVDKPSTLWGIFSDPDLTCGELYIDEKWDMLEGDLGHLLSWFCQNNRELIHRLPGPGRHVNDSESSRKNVAHHYDLGNDLYESFLDSDMNYSCAFFEDHRMSLADAQRNKLYTTLLRADIQPGMNVLDMGCGWGELCRVIARAIPDTKVTGITLAENQLTLARERAPAGGPEFHFADYRQYAQQHAGSFDRIVSVGMFEHVGREHFDEFFAAVHKLLKPGGKALVHSIMRPEPGDATSRWLNTYIFPGGCIPYMPEALEKADKNGLRVAREPYIHDGSNYAETLRRWRGNFNAQAHTLDPMKYDARFKRIWNYYLAMSEAAFDGLGYYVGQMVFEK